MNAAPPMDGIRWPAHYDPSRTLIHVRNELQVSASPSAVWSWLVRADGWPRWYPNASNVRFLDHAGPDLRDGTHFRWRTFGITIRSTVQEFVPETRIAWDGKAIGLDVYHAWLLTPTADGGCHVLTEETQHGVVARVGKRLFPDRMSRFHQLWLVEMARRAAGGPPPR